MSARQYRYGSGDHPALHCFPTRRSSDLTYTIERNPDAYTANWLSQPWQEDPTRTYTYGLYLQDQMKIGDRLQVLLDRKSTRLNSSHVAISYAVFCLKKKPQKWTREQMSR